MPGHGVGREAQGAAIDEAGDCAKRITLALRHADDLEGRSDLLLRQAVITYSDDALVTMRVGDLRRALDAAREA